MIVKPDNLRAAVRVANLLDPKPGTEWGPRIIGDMEIVLLVSGELLYERGGDAVRVKGGEVLLILPGVRHRLSVLDAGKRTVMACIHFEPIRGERYALGDCVLEPAPPVITATGGDYIVRDLFVRCAQAFKGYSRFRSALCQSIFSELWVRLCEIWVAGADAVLSPRMVAFVSYVRMNLGSQISRNELAAEFGVTPQYVNALFKKELGITPSELINRERVHRAARLMAEQGLSVKEAAARVGFNDQFYFSRVFKRIMMYPPSRTI